MQIQSSRITFAAPFPEFKEIVAEVLRNRCQRKLELGHRMALAIVADENY
jgi:hypothetical protein